MQILEIVVIHKRKNLFSRLDEYNAKLLVPIAQTDVTEALGGGAG
jgi:hypothetical protein